MQPAAGTRVRFGPYVADVAAGELRKNGRSVRLQEQPFQILVALLGRAGEVVTREELRERLWPNYSFGDFDQGLNTAINKLREALADSAANPQFIETLPKRGYRFTHPVEAEPIQSVVQHTPAKRLSLAKPFDLSAIVTILITVGVFALRWARPPAREQQLSLRRFTIKHPVPGSSLDYRLLAVSPDGSHIVITADRGDSRLWIRDLDQEQPRPLEGTEGAWSPFWSPDSKTIGFSVYGKIQKISAKGGPPIVLCDVGDCRIDGGSWSPDGASIVFATGSSETLLYRVPASGGTARLLLSPQMLDGSQVPGRLSQPYFLPGEGRAEAVIFVYKDSLIVRETATGRYQVLGRGTYPSYSPNGHLVYRFGNDLWSRPFSLHQLSFAGEAFRIARDATDPSISSDGTLVYRDAAAQQLVWVNRQGSRIGTVGQPANGVYYPALSPDGQYAAVETMENENLDVWVVDISRGTRIRLTSDPAAEILPAWAPEGDAVAFSSYRTGKTDIFVRPADARIEERPIANTPASERVSDWSSDGQYVLYSVVDQKSGYDIHYLQRNTGGRWESHAFLQTNFNEKVAKFSPNGRYVAYLSDESGRDEVYVRQFPSGGRTWPVSAGGAAQIRWSRNGRELFYAQLGTLIATSVRTEPAFAVGSATRLFSHGAFLEFWDPNYDVSADGQRILLPESVKASEERAIHVVQNWFAEFKDRR